MHVPFQAHIKIFTWNESEKAPEMKRSKCILRSYLKSKMYFQGLIIFINVWLILNCICFLLKWNFKNPIPSILHCGIVEPVFSDAVFFMTMWIKIPVFRRIFKSGRDLVDKLKWFWIEWIWIILKEQE